ncbi:MAG: cytochrome c oxidase subunit II [Acidobacteria bacterium]|nr:cytochrome c oxidase subunit II [Acidobacteriota bacterium]
MADNLNIHQIAVVPEQVTNIFKPLATPSESIYQISLLTLAICGVIFLIVGGLLVYTIIRFRTRSNDEQSEPPQIYGSNQIELAWTVFPILIVFVLILVTARTISDVQNATHPPDSLKVTVVGHQWWWEIRYPDLGIVTANELHVPVSDPAKPRRTVLKLQSADVAHSYWVPQLSGKVDLIPNRDNYMWFDPKQTGLYLGNCAEYCGTQHAHMLIRVIVHQQEEFDRWVLEQQKPAVDNREVTAGRKVFLSTSCVNCHTISGTIAGGKFGPDLTHLMSRDTLGAGAIKNTPNLLRAWVHDPQKLKEGCLMPDMQLSQQELDLIVAYLSTLK